MRQFTKVLPSFTAVGFGNTARLIMEVGRTFQKIVLDTRDSAGNVTVTADEILKVIIQLNGREILNVSGEQLVMLEKYRGFGVVDGTIVIDYSLPHANSEQGRALSHLVTTPSDNMVLSVELKDKTTNTVPLLKGYAVQSNNVSPQRVVVPVLVNSSIQIGQTGLNTYRTYVRGPRIVGIHFLDKLAGASTHAITDLEIKRDDQTIHNLSTKLSHEAQIRSGFVPQANYTHFNPVLSKAYIVDTLRTRSNKFEIMPTVRRAGDITALFYQLETEGNVGVDFFELASR